jgi:hypothetical protein
VLNGPSLGAALLLADEILAFASGSIRLDLVGAVRIEPNAIERFHLASTYA